MKMKCFIVVVSCLIIVDAWTSIEPTSIDPNLPDFCVSSNPKVGVMKRGETKSVPDNCFRATCSPGLISYAGCGKILPKKGCYVGNDDLEKPYPQCCGKEVCPDEK